MDVLHPVDGAAIVDIRLCRQCLRAKGTLPLLAADLPLKRLEHQAVSRLPTLLRKARDALLEFLGDLQGRRYRHGVTMVTPGNESQKMATKVFLDYDQKALDDAYDQAVYAPNREQVVGRFATESDRARDMLGAPERLAYGDLPIEGMDLFRTRRTGLAPVVVFVHGGAWQRGLAQNYAFPAPAVTGAGAHYIAIDFQNVTETKGDLMPMALQVRSAIAWVVKNCARFGGDSARVHVVGHSSGAHLAGCAAITDWKADHGLPADAVKGYTLVSGMYDLRGPRLSKRSAYVKFTDAVEDALSAQRHLDRINAPIALVYGTLETPEFQRQSSDFATALSKVGKRVSLLRAEGYNHFEICETLANPYGPAGRVMLEQMGLS